MNIITRLRRFRWHWLERRKIKREIKEAVLRGNVNVIIGAGLTNYHGWIKTDYPFFDLLNMKHWNYFFSNYKADKFLAEHVFEHFYEEQIQFVLKMASRFMNKGGCIRIAVPDGFHPDKKYIDYVRPNGSGAGADDHKVLLNYKSLSDLLKRSGLEPTLIEYWDENGELKENDCKPENGYIKRTKKNINQSKTPDNYGFVYTSLVVDGMKK